MKKKITYFIIALSVTVAILTAFAGAFLPYGIVMLIIVTISVVFLRRK